MSFAASALGVSKHFGVDTPSRILYDGDYVPGPVDISVEARETATGSDDTFSSQGLSLNIDLDKLTGSDKATVTMDLEDDSASSAKVAKRLPKTKSRAGGRE